jgi:transmembrane sensor
VVNAPARQVLPDGSMVDLRPGAAIRVVFSDATRRVVLERGEAHFAVTKNAERPFIVQAGTVEARAVGTAFSVELTAMATEVVVTEGEVAVQRPVAPVSTAPAVDAFASEVETLALLTAGHRAVVEARPPKSAAAAVVEELSSAALGERLAWRVPTLEFSGTPLEDAIPMLNRHGAVRLVLAERGIGAVRLSGVIRADNTGTLLRLLKEEHGITAERRADGDVVLSRAR